MVGVLCFMWQRVNVHWEKEASQEQKKKKEQIILLLVMVSVLMIKIFFFLGQWTKTMSVI